MGKIIRNGIEFSSTSDTADNINYNNSQSGLEAMTAQEAIDEVNENVSTLTESLNNYVAKSKQAAVLYQGNCGTDDNVPLADYLYNYNFIRLELCIGGHILNTVTINTSEFVLEKYTLRCGYRDSVDEYYQDISYVSDTIISVACTTTTQTRGMFFRVIGFYNN